MKPATALHRLTLLLFALPALCAAGGISGKVVLDGPAPAPKKVDVTIDQYACGTSKEAEELVVSPQRAIANVVVSIENPPAGAAWPANATKPVVDQRGCVFVPRIVVVRAGGTVDFLNNDRLLHNIHATPKLNVAFNRTQPKDRTIPITFQKPEIVRIDCDLHSWMRAYVVVAAHPYYRVTPGDGAFAFDNLPPGRYRLQIWHERLGTTTHEVTVPDQGNATASIALKAQ
jgi:plastocyanin